MCRMKRARLATYIATGLIGISMAFPVNSEDIFVEWPFTDGAENICHGTTFERYTVDVASFMTRHDRDLCQYQGPIAMYATMTRHAGSAQLLTVTSTTTCPATVDCDSWVTMPHPNIEGPTYELTWEYYDLNGGWLGTKWSWVQCHSRIVIANCTQHYAIRVPDP